MINPEKIDRYSKFLTCRRTVSIEDEVANVIKIILETQVVPVKHEIIVKFLIGDFDSDIATHSFSTGKESRNLGMYILNSSQYKYKDKIDLDKLEIAGIFHDIGKVYIPTEILNNKNKLTENEFALIKEHPKYSFEILKKFYSDPEILMAVLSHHEKYDGSGYPNNLKNDEIPILAQIIAITDVYDALTSKRPYREELSPDKALDLMQTFDGHFNQDIFKIFLESKKPLISPIPVPPDNGRTPILPA
jgi:putative nucleotidyltransferase with HDIG domain